MCDWNRAHRKEKDRVHLLGFDVQDFQAQVHFAGTDLLGFLGRIGILVPDPRAGGLLQCARVDDSVPVPSSVPDSTHQACLESLDALDELFSDPGSAAEITRQTSA